MAQTLTLISHYITNPTFATPAEREVRPLISEIKNVRWQSREGTTAKYKDNALSGAENLESASHLSVEIMDFVTADQMVTALKDAAPHIPVRSYCLETSSVIFDTMCGEVTLFNTQGAPNVGKALPIPVGATRLGAPLPQSVPQTAAGTAAMAALSLAS